METARTLPDLELRTVGEIDLAKLVNAWMQVRQKFGEIIPFFEILRDLGVTKKDVLDVRKIFSDNIKRILFENDWSNKDLAEKIGVANSTISDWRNSKAFPTAKQINALCELLGVTPDYLFKPNTSLKPPQPAASLEEAIKTLQLIQNALKEAEKKKDNKNNDD